MEIMYIDTIFYSCFIIRSDIKTCESTDYCMSVSRKDLLLTSSVLFTGFRVGMVHYMDGNSSPLYQGLKQLLFTVSPIAILYNYVNVYSNMHMSRKIHSLY